jgi:3-keto-5-aminohexanoate cleavage enzyme
MISIITSHHDEAFAEEDFYVLHPREELDRYANLSREFGVLLEYEIWGSGSIWNLNYLIDKDLIKPPYFTTNFFGWPGGAWSPPTVAEYISRRGLLPDNCIFNTSVMGSEKMKLLVHAILHGDHVRVGTEDSPFLVYGKVASTSELVSEIANISLALGRPISTCDQTRIMLGIDIVRH